jgi:hypothetical protein
MANTAGHTVEGTEVANMASHAKGVLGGLCQVR